MSYDVTVRETDHGDGFGPEPTVTLTVNGSHDVSRLVHLLSKSGNCEQGRLLDELVEQLRANPGGLDTLRMLRGHGGNDYTGEVFQQWAVRHPEVLLSVHTSRNAALYTLSKLPGGVLVTRMSNEDDDAWTPEESAPGLDVYDVAGPEPSADVLVLHDPAGVDINGGYLHRCAESGWSWSDSVDTMPMPQITQGLVWGVPGGSVRERAQGPLVVIRRRFSNDEQVARG